MEKAVEREPDWVGLPVIATVARLLCREDRVSECGVKGLLGREAAIVFLFAGAGVRWGSPEPAQDGPWAPDTHTLDSWMPQISSGTPRSPEAVLPSASRQHSRFSR